MSEILKEHKKEVYVQKDDENISSVQILKQLFRDISKDIKWHKVCKQLIKDIKRYKEDNKTLPKKFMTPDILKLVRTGNDGKTVAQRLVEKRE
ncbi:MAG: hypothetical protein M1168_02220 [Candidatus Marsarchaeota archaeon]|nr:hypothetical protein [Candidatus Marsarchaeota archaeon]MCL5094776.1 hypothetical protein [Candidatus Marsarchaeota archaeon]